MATKAATDSQQLATLSAQLAHKYTQLANDSVGAAAAATNGEVGIRLKEVELTHSLTIATVVTLIQSRFF